MNSISVKTIKGDTEAFIPLFDIYKTSFPLSEQKSEDTIRSLLNRPDYAVFILEREEQTVGFAIYFCSIESPFYLLEYMAIDPAQRSGGLGNYLFNRSAELLINESISKPIWIEIDTPSGNDMSAPEHRRERFYRNAGCKRVIGFNYILGLKTLHIPPPMSLMVFAPGRNAIAKTELRTHVESIYQNVYGRSENEPEIDQMFNNVGDILKLS